MPHTETKLESKEIFDGHVIHVTLDTVRLEDGRTSLREVVHHHGGACVLPIDDEGCIWSASSATRWARRSGSCPPVSWNPERTRLNPPSGN